jgi:hypothetical protein
MAARTLASLKRSVADGTRIECLYHWWDDEPTIVAREQKAGHPPMGQGSIRTVEKVQGNGYYFTLAGHEKRYWSDWPKASQITWHDDGSWTSEPIPGRSVRLRVVEEVGS